MRCCAFHTSPQGFGKVMSTIEPRHAVAYHFYTEEIIRYDLFQGILETDDGPLSLATPVMVASGTFGYGVEFETLLDLSRLGGLVSKGLYMEPRDGNPVPRIAETPAGLPNAPRKPSALSTEERERSVISTRLISISAS